MKQENINLKDEIKIEYKENAIWNKNLTSQIKEIQEKGKMFAAQIEQETRKNVL